MQEITDRIHRAVRTANYADLRGIIQELVYIGLCDKERAREIIEAETCSTTSATE